MSRRDSDPREPSPCRYCEAMILWARNERTNKPMPFDEQPDRDLTKGWELFVRNDEALARYVREPRPGQRLRRPHFETCTDYTPKGKSSAPKQGDLVGRDHVAEARAAMPEGYMAMYGRPGT